MTRKGGKTFKAKFSYGCDLRPCTDTLFSKPIYIFDHPGGFSSDDIDTNNINILVVLEPYSIRETMRWMPNSNILEHRSLFNYIISYDEEILKKCENAIFLAYGNCSFSFNKISEIPIKEKEFGISACCGFKRETDGHRLRHSVYNRQSEIDIPKRFYNSSRTPMVENPFNNHSLGSEDNDKLNLFDTMFHLCIENSIEKDYFTEKIIDCLISKTVPIYYGCFEINKYFNKKGIVEINDDVDNIIKVINELDDKLYYRLSNIIDENYNKAIGFISFYSNLCDLIKRLIV